MNVFSIDALENRHVIVTGASGGIGSETAKAVVKMGGKVTITARDAKKLDLLKQELTEYTPQDNINLHIADLTSENEQTHLVDKAVEKLGPVYALVNCAGITGGGIVDDTSKEELEFIMDLNYTSAVMLTKLVYQSMKQQKRGAIINVSSLSGLRGTYGNTAYAGSKFALIGFTHSFAFEAIEYGVRVNAVCPGYVNTPMGIKAIEKRAVRNGITFEEQLKSIENEYPSGKLTQPEEVANTIAYLLTDAAPNIIGESVKISGGSVMR
ncbi:SDR family NAD(P)-dependent oxidoreductase [Bacillus sp. Marseille-Q3570]|uniref:SDR family NAD(P)-dependent oxidoreductase n=1 Tax=Bacillus sp. Marseille-Q3570 TaxID=2963522 RepID=UPI0021B6FCBC|nr:SDR family oxidoreductase [Bacillus sp. Marseille-Q3570]